MQRKLFMALDKEGNKFHIDSARQDREYFCPHCKAPVIPKCGEKNVWHFAHKDGPCGFLLLKMPDDSRDSTLDLSREKTKDLGEIDIGSGSRDFLCVKCKKRFNKQSGIKWDKTEYICQDCFRKL